MGKRIFFFLICRLKQSSELGRKSPAPFDLCSYCEEIFKLLSVSLLCSKMSSVRTWDLRRTGNAGFCWRQRVALRCRRRFLKDYCTSLKDFFLYMKAETSAPRLINLQFNQSGGRTERQERKRFCRRQEVHRLYWTFVTASWMDWAM